MRSGMHSIRQIRAFGRPAGLWRPKGLAVAGSSDLGLAAVGERQWSWPEPGGCLRCFGHLSGAIGCWSAWRHRGRVLGGSGWSGAHWEPDRAGWPVQQESTATGADLTGRARTSWDGDLHRSTAVDVLPADGMQEVRGSNPRSSTLGQKDKFEILSPRFTGLVQQQDTAAQRHDVLVCQL
jgi:hypothetical protein